GVGGVRCCVELSGLEPLTPTLPVWCATSCAIAPYSLAVPAHFSATGSTQVTPRRFGLPNRLRPHRGEVGPGRRRAGQPMILVSQAGSWMSTSSPSWATDGVETRSVMSRMLCCALSALSEALSIPPLVSTLLMHSTVSSSAPADSAVEASSLAVRSPPPSAGCWAKKAFLTSKKVLRSLLAATHWTAARARVEYSPDPDWPSRKLRVWNSTRRSPPSTAVAMGSPYCASKEPHAGHM